LKRTAINLPSCATAPQAIRDRLPAGARGRRTVARQRQRHKAGSKQAAGGYGGLIACTASRQAGGKAATIRQQARGKRHRQRQHAQAGGKLVVVFESKQDCLAIRAPL